MNIRKHMELSDIKPIRKRLGLTQQDLAQRSGVSQSLIAKTEAGLIEPAFSKAKKIMDTLSEITNKTEQKAEDIMRTRIISVSPDSSLKDAIALMKKHNISQLPVLGAAGPNPIPVGMISESIILDAIISNSDLSIKKIMKDTPPIITGNTTVTAITALLRFFPMVLISDNGKLRGIITKSDIINSLS